MQYGANTILGSLKKQMSKKDQLQSNDSIKDIAEESKSNSKNKNIHKTNNSIASSYFELVKTQSFNGSWEVTEENCMKIGLSDLSET